MSACINKVHSGAYGVGCDIHQLLYRKAKVLMGPYGVRINKKGIQTCMRVRYIVGHLGLDMTTTAYSTGLQGPEGVIWGKNDIQWYECKHQ